MIKYIFIGIVWTLFLEYMTTKSSYTVEAVNWTNRERVVQVFIWPISMVLFFIEFIKGLWR